MITTSAYIGLASGFIGIGLMMIKMTEIGHNRSEHRRGWEDCERARSIMTEDDEILLAEMKTALSLYVKKTGLRRKGDEKKIQAVETFAALKNLAWELTVHRKVG